MPEFVLVIGTDLMTDCKIKQELEELSQVSPLLLQHGILHDFVLLMLLNSCCQVEQTLRT